MRKLAALTALTLIPLANNNLSTATIGININQKLGVV